MVTHVADEPSARDKRLFFAIADETRQTDWRRAVNRALGHEDDDFASDMAEMAMFGAMDTAKPGGCVPDPHYENEARKCLEALGLDRESEPGSGDAVTLEYIAQNWRRLDEKESALPARMGPVLIVRLCISC